MIYRGVIVSMIMHTFHHKYVHQGAKQDNPKVEKLGNGNLENCQSQNSGKRHDHAQDHGDINTLLLVSTILIVAIHGVPFIKLSFSPHPL